MRASSLLRFLIGLKLVACLPALTAEESETLYTDFANGFGPWEPLFTGTWRHAPEDGAVVLEETGNQRPPVRRPGAYLLLEQHVWSDLQLTLEAKTLEPATNPYRDIVILFGYLDDTHYYYAHCSSLSDDLFHNVIMRVDGESRTTIHRETLPPPILTDRWHQIVLTHSAEGHIAVYLDDLEHPMMTAYDQHYPAGAVGFGSFDDPAAFRTVEVTGIVEPLPTIAPKWTSEGWRLEHRPGFRLEIGRSSDLSHWESSLIEKATPVIDHFAPPEFLRARYLHPVLATEDSDSGS